MIALEEMESKAKGEKRYEIKDDIAFKQQHGKAYYQSVIGE